MNAQKAYHRNPAGRNRNLPFIRYQTKGLGPACERIKGEQDYSNPAYRFYWAEHVSAMMDLTATASKVLAQIIRDQRQKGYCTRSVSNLGVACACSPRTVARALAMMRKDGSLFIHEWYRPRGRGRTASHIYVNWEHARWNGCGERGVSETPTENGQLTNSMTANLADDSLRENFREPATAISMTVEEQTATPSSAEEKSQAENGKEPEKAPATAQRAVMGTLIELGVPARIAISDAAKAPVEAFAVLAMVYRILNRGGIRNPAGLARAALRDPSRYLAGQAVSGQRASGQRSAISDQRVAGAVEPVPRIPTWSKPVEPGCCWKCGRPLDPLEGCVGGMHFACDEASRG